MKASSKIKTIEQELKSFSLEHLEKAWRSTQIEGDWEGCWRKEEGNKPMNKKNIINSLLEDAAFKSEDRADFTDSNGEYNGWSLGEHVTTEESVLEYLKKFDK